MDTIPPEAIRALQQGNKITAIKIVREHTGCDLKAAKDAVERYADMHPQQDWQEGEWGRGAADEGPTPAMQGNGPPGLTPAALAALARGQKVEAIRLVREATGLGLAQAKQLVDDHQNPPAGDFGHVAQGVRHDPLAEPGRVASGGEGKWLLVVVVLVVALAAWLYFKP